MVDGASIEPVELCGRHVRLIPMDAHHAPGLYAASRNEEVWRYLPVQVETLEEMREWVQQALTERQTGHAFPFVIVHTASQSIVGSTRYIDINPQHRNLEIGWTWLSPVVWRTPVNTECKRLLLGHCFEELGMIRVMLKTDGRNLRSQRAIERLGAVKEGVLRHHRIMPDGYLRDSVVYSILAEEWPEIRRRLEKLLEAPPDFGF